MADNPIVAANTVFGAKLLGQLAAKSGSNIVFSPLSITLALLLAHAGADNATEAAIETTIGLGRISRERAAAEAHTLIDTLAALDEQGAQRSGPFGEPEETTWLRIANALFANNKVAFRESYVQIVRDQFRAEVAALDFGSPNAAATINAWVNERTRGKIREIAGELNNDIAAVLLNAVYFKSAWANPFVESATRQDTFTLANNEHIRVPMMANTERYGYRREADFEIVALPFRGGNLEMVVVLPRANSIAALTNSFTNPSAWQALDTRPTRVALRMPRFRVECDISLNESLIALGMGVAFDNRADFSRMVEPPEQLAISDVRHKTFLDVNEKGVEAAAATAIKMMRMSAMPEHPIEVTVDRPFLCALREKQSGTLLFIGSIGRP